MLNVYIRLKDPRLAELTKRFDALFAMYEQVEAAWALADKAKSMRVRGGERPTAQKELALWFERQRIYEAACLKLHTLIKVDMHPFIEPLNEECKRLRAEPFLTDRLERFTRHQDVMANILTAETLYNEAAEALFTTEHKTKYYRTVTTDLFDNPAHQREWVVMVGAGGGFRFGGEDPNAVPPGPHMTEQEATEDGWGWRSEADTIGGDAQLYNVRTKEIKPLR